MAHRNLALKVVTFNTYHAYPLCAHIERRLELLRRGLGATAPDVVLLQEISVSTLYGHLPARRRALSVQRHGGNSDCGRVR